MDDDISAENLENIELIVIHHFANNITLYYDIVIIIIIISTLEIFLIRRERSRNFLQIPDPHRSVEKLFLFNTAFDPTNVQKVPICPRSRYEYVIYYYLTTESFSRPLWYGILAINRISKQL